MVTTKRGAIDRGDSGAYAREDDGRGDANPTRGLRAAGLAAGAACARAAAGWGAGVTAAEAVDGVLAVENGRLLRA